MQFDPLALLCEMETEIIANMTALLARGAGASSDWQAAKLAEVAQLRALNILTVTKYTDALRAGLYAQYKNTGTQAVLSAQIAGLSADIPEALSSTLARVWILWETQTMAAITAMGMSLIDAAQTKYINIVYQSAALRLSGAITLRDAIARTAVSWIGDGLPALVDKGGRTWTTEAYAQMVLRTNATQVAKASQIAAFEEFDVDLVEISSHLGARPLCAPYQGRVFSRSGRSTKFPALSSTSMGEPAGLFGINCGHHMYAYNPAVGKTYRPYNKKINDAAYSASQEQRAYERAIRNKKSVLDIAEKFKKSPQIVQAARRDVAQAQANMRKFISSSGRTRRRDREQIY